MADEELVEVFRTGDEMVAQTAIEEVLAPNGIDGVVHDRVSHALPTATAMGEYFVAVPSEQVTLAAAVLRDALQDGALVDGDVVIEG